MVTLLNHVGSMQLSACFEGGADPMKENQWNRDHFFHRDAKQTQPWPATAASVPGLLQINRNASLKYDSDQWRQNGSGDYGQFVFAHSSGHAHALVIAEPIAMPIGSVEDVALANAQSVDPHARVVFRKRRRVSAGNGTVQAVTYTEKTRFPEYEKSFTDFLNGFVVSK